MDPNKVSAGVNIAGAAIAAGLQAVPSDLTIPPWALAIMLAVNAALHTYSAVAAPPQVPPVTPQAKS